MRTFPGMASYGALLAVAVADVLWLRITGLTLPPAQLVQPLGHAAVLMASGLALTTVPAPERARPALDRVGCLLQGIAFLQVAWIAVRVFNHASMATDLPYADALLASWDRALGLDWQAYFRFVQERPALIGWLDRAYGSLSQLSVLAFLVLMLHRDLRRPRYFLETFFATAVLCTAIGLLFPARAAVATYLGDLPGFANFAGPPGLYHLAHLERLRGDLPVSLDLASLPGLVTFPSFHTAAGIVLAASFWRTWLFWPAAAYTTVMIAATPVFGGHYFVDLIAGAAAAALVLRVFAAQPRYAGMFRRSPASPAPAHPLPTGRRMPG